jgi:hypothetical protein
MCLAVDDGPACIELSSEVNPANRKARSSPAALAIAPTSVDLVAEAPQHNVAGGALKAICNIASESSSLEIGLARTVDWLITQPAAVGSMAA